MEKQINSAQRVRDHREVFTREQEVKAMLDCVCTEDLRNSGIEARYLEPACGMGNFWIEILRRKLAHRDCEKFKKHQREWEITALVALSSLYGVDLLEDNVLICRQRLNVSYF